jgi:rubrerythrin
MDNDQLRSVQHRSPMSRRAFGRCAALGGVGFATGAVLATPARAQAALTDVDILNLALNLEYLEAEFYTKATTGQTIEEFGLDTSGTGNAGPTTGGRAIAFGSSTRGIMLEIAQNERDHVEFLRSALGAAAVAKPAINLDALGAIEEDQPFIALARALEDIGVSAYGGAARYIQNEDFREAAARIALTEAYHAGNLRLIVALKGIPTMQLDPNDYPPPPSGEKYFNTSRIGLAKIRTPTRILAFAYAGGAGTSSGGFFPNGVNGPINTV